MTKKPNPKAAPMSKHALGIDIVSFFEWAGTLGISGLSAPQKMTLKAIRGEPLDTKTPIHLTHPIETLDFENEVEMFKHFAGKDEYETKIYGDATLAFGRRSGKTLSEDTEVLTPQGPVKIKDIKVGDTVYGFNSDGSVTPTPVLRIHDNGVKEVFELVNSNKVLAAGSADHRWLTSLRVQSRSGKIAYKVEERQTKDFVRDQFVERRFVKIPCGPVSEPHAYAIGALLGNGCCSSSRGKRDLWISCPDDKVPNKVTTVLGADSVTKNHDKNYTWIIRKDNISCNHYNEWFKGKRSWEKTLDLEVIKTWDRESSLALLAGLLDTDGSVFSSSDTKSLNIQFGCQSKSAVEVYQYLFYKLWQHKLAVHFDDREKNVNGPIYYVNCKSNLYSKMALHELDSHLVTESKKWKPAYSDLPEQRSDQRLGVTVGKSYQAQTYDLEIGNDTHLYLLANEGLITHNSTSLGAGLAIYYATQFDYTPFLRTSPHATIPLISASKEQAGEIYAAIKQFFLKSPYLYENFLDGQISRFQEEFEEDSLSHGRIKGGVIHLNNRVVIKVMAADIGKIRGMAVPFAILDENAFYGIEGNDTKNTDKAIFEALAPALSQFQEVEGMALILKISSPNGQAGLMYEDYENRKDIDVLHLQIPSWHANPSLPVSYLEKQRKKGVAYFNREYGAQYTASEASYLDPDLIDKAIIRGIDALDCQPQFRYACTMDYATKDDYWAFSIGHKEYYWDKEAKEKKSIVYIDKNLKWRGTGGAELDPTEIIPQICAEMKKYRIPYCLADQYAFAALKPLFQKEGCLLKEYKVSNSSKLKYMYSLQVATNSSALRLVHDTLAIKHLKDLREKRSSGANKIKVEGAAGCKDDLANTIALTVYQFDTSSPVYVGLSQTDEGPPSTKDLRGKQLLTPTAEDLAEHVGLMGFTDNRAEIEAETNPEAAAEKEDGNNFWFIF